MKTTRVVLCILTLQWNVVLNLKWNRALALEVSCQSSQFKSTPLFFPLSSNPSLPSSSVSSSQTCLRPRCHDSNTRARPIATRLTNQSPSLLPWLRFRGNGMTRGQQPGDDHQLLPRRPSLTSVKPIRNRGFVGRKRTKHKQTVSQIVILETWQRLTVAQFENINTHTCAAQPSSQSPVILLSTQV